MYINDKDDYPVFLELVHNTDDDSLILFYVDDATDLNVKEVNMTLDLSENQFWQLILQRFGRNVEQLLCNIETIFRSNEFNLIV